MCVYCDHLSDEDIRRAWFEPCRSIEGLLEELREQFGPSMRLCVIPEGPQTIAYLRELGGDRQADRVHNAQRSAAYLARFAGGWACWRALHDVITNQHYDIA